MTSGLCDAQIRAEEALRTTSSKLQRASTGHLRRHGESEPRSVGARRRTLTAYLCCGEQPDLATAALRRASPPATAPGLCALALALSAPWHGDFPRSNPGSELPVCALRSRASPASGCGDPWPPLQPASLHKHQTLPELLNRRRRATSKNVGDLVWHQENVCHTRQRRAILKHAAILNKYQ